MSNSRKEGAVSDPYSFFTDLDPDPAFKMNPNPDPREYFSRIKEYEENLTFLFLIFHIKNGCSEICCLGS